MYILGIRSATDVTEEVLRSAKRLLAVGCFCIGAWIFPSPCPCQVHVAFTGTNQVNLKVATDCGIPVFNSPFSNSRSVAGERLTAGPMKLTKRAELIIGQVIALARRLGEANAEMHSGVWKKYTTGRYEIRGKTLGIVGYGNIGAKEDTGFCLLICCTKGTQLSVLAEGLGLRVIFFDTGVKLALGNAQVGTTQ